MRLGDETLEVTAGDLIRNEPGQTHGIVNTGTDPLRFFVFDADTRPR
jgi:mannose-6-phosphate isomerase-like protein (cupin superfamily)